MRIAVMHRTAEEAQAWRDALSMELREAEVFVWAESSRVEVDYAVGLVPPQEFFARQPNLKAFFSVWSGVEHLLARKDLPPALPIFRLEDAGMGAQMADYCICEVLRWLRRRDEYGELQRSRIWRKLPAENLSSW